MATAAGRWSEFPLDRLRATYFDSPGDLSWRASGELPAELQLRIQADARPAGTMLVRSPSDGVYFHKSREGLEKFVATDWAAVGLEAALPRVLRQRLICPRDWYRQQLPYALLCLHPAVAGPGEPVIEGARLVMISADLFYEHAPSASAVLLWGLGLLTKSELFTIDGADCNFHGFRFANRDDSLVYWCLCNNQMLALPELDLLPVQYTLGADATGAAALHMHDRFSLAAREAAVRASGRGEDPLLAACSVDVLPGLAGEPSGLRLVRVEDFRGKPLLQGMFYNLAELLQAAGASTAGPFVLCSRSHPLADYPTAGESRRPFLHSLDGYLQQAAGRLGMERFGGDPSQPIVFVLSVGAGWVGPATLSIEPSLGSLKSLADGELHVDEAFARLAKMLN